MLARIQPRHFLFRTDAQTRNQVDQVEKDEQGAKSPHKAGSNSDELNTDDPEAAPPPHIEDFISLILSTPQIAPFSTDVTFLRRLEG